MSDHCPCPYSCSNHANCQACIIKHRERGEVPFCLNKVVDKLIADSKK